MILLIFKRLLQQLTSILNLDRVCFGYDVSLLDLTGLKLGLIWADKILHLSSMWLQNFIFLVPYLNSHLALVFFVASGLDHGSRQIIIGHLHVLLEIHVFRIIYIANVQLLL